MAGVVPLNVKVARICYELGLEEKMPVAKAVRTAK